MKNILVLGGSGYLGSKVISDLLNIGNASVGGYNLVCTKRKMSNISRIQHSNCIRWIDSSCVDIEETFRREQFYAVLNMACDYGRSEALYSGVIDSNVVFPLKTLDTAVQYRVQNFITIGTGLPDDLNMYSYSKKVLSDFGRFYAQKHNINFVNVKLEMLYGADEPRDRFIPSVILKMLQGAEVNVTLGTQHRDIIAVEDIVYAIKVILQSRLKGYNEISVGTGVAPSISELIDYIWERTGKKSKVNKGAIKMRNKEPDCVADTLMIKKLCEWKPVYWQDGISVMIEKIHQAETGLCKN